MDENSPSPTDYASPNGVYRTSSDPPTFPSSTATPLENSSASAHSSTNGPASTGHSKPTTDAHGRALNPRSCVTCRKRKVRCDKLHPCTNCNRAQIECVFPAPGRAPRKTRKLTDGRDKELLERLRRLEGVVKGLGVDVLGEPEKEYVDEEVGQVEASTEQAARNGTFDMVNGHADLSAPAKPPTNVTKEQEFRDKTQWIDDEKQGRFENRFGRLVVNEGKSRYINNSFWASLSNEVEDLKGILNQSSDEEDIMDSSTGSQAHNPSSHHGFIFGFSSQNVQMLNLHPLPNQIMRYWDIYKDRVDPLVKVLHVPTLELTIVNAASHLNNLPRGLECLLFTIYYGAVTSLSADECLTKLGEDKSVLLARYRFAIEQALARANVLTTEEIVVLQAFVVFLICLRRNNDARVIWTLTGLVVRIAQTIGIHRDGSHFGLPPFEVELRRRLWWQVCILDTRASEDHGCDPTIIEQSFDTKMPLNINDADMTPAMRDYPPERQGCTDMSFCLLRFEVTNTFRRINYVPPGPSRASTEYLTSVTLEDKERWITECHQRLEERYLKHCDMSVPLFWVTATVARLMMSKMWLMVYHPFQRADCSAQLSEETKDKLFITSLENLEYSLLLETEARTMKWGWLFRTYMQWHALAFTLSELCLRTTGDMVDRAWVAVDKTKDGRWGVHITEENNTGHLWRPLKKIYRKAKEARQRGLQELQYGKSRGMNPPMRTYSPNANPMFGHPQRPRVTRAPLSQAQLMRFTEGPTYGHTPLDKHELLRTPSLGETASNERSQEMPASKVNDVHHQAQQDAAHHPFQRQSSADMLANNFHTAKPGFGHAPSLANQESADFANVFPRGYPLATNSHDAMQMDPVQPHDALENDLLMDTSGDLDLNWENWDQLVRQFGMDIDSSGPDQAGMHLAWNAPVWDVDGSIGAAGTAVNGNPRMAFGDQF